MTFGSKKMSANGSKYKGKNPKAPGGAANLSKGYSGGKPGDGYYAPVYHDTGSSKKSSDGRLKKISQPGINPKGSSRVG